MPKQSILVLRSVILFTGGGGGGEEEELYLDQTGMCHQSLRSTTLFWSGKSQNVQTNFTDNLSATSLGKMADFETLTLCISPNSSQMLSACPKKYSRLANHQIVAFCYIV